MQTQNPDPDTLTLSGDYESRIADLLRIAQRCAQIAQAGAERHMQDALADLENSLSDHLAALANAAEDDKADAEASGEAERERRSWHPLRAA